MYFALDRQCFPLHAINFQPNGVRCLRPKSFSLVRPGTIPSAHSSCEILGGGEFEKRVLLEPRRPHMPLDKFGGYGNIAGTQWLDAT